MRNTLRLHATVVALFGLISFSGFAAGERKSTESLLLYIDADFSNNLKSSQAIERGILTALSEYNNVINGRDIVVKRMNHRGNVARSKRNMDAYLDDPSVLAIYSGLHSSPLLVHRDHINRNEILYLDPWAAAAPITRYPSDENWIFRLSIDDSKAGEVIVSFAVDKQKKMKPCLLLENTGWGESNFKTMTKALAGRDLSPLVVLRFDWGLKAGAARALINTCVKNGSDSIYLVANALEGASLVKAIAKSDRAKKWPIYSHWGIAGGSFHQMVSEAERRELNLFLLQTQFSFLNANLNEKQSSVLEKAIGLFPDYHKAKDIESAVGFIHAYDLTLLLIEAIKKSNVNTEIDALRRMVRAHLESLDAPIDGLVKTYHFPFSVFSKSNMDAHEALTEFDISIGRFVEENTIMLEPWKYKPFKATPLEQ